ncbi:MAG: sugar phosphate nucleotidyltransferase [Candidatus Eisenbacteria bacterium]
MRAVVLAGGKGTRLAPYTTVFPKPLMPIDGMPILEVVIRQLKAHGFDRITLAVGYLASLIEAYFGDGSRFGVAIDYSREEGPLGTAGPLRLVVDLDETFLVMNGDLLTTLDFGKMLSFHRDRKCDATLGLFSREVKIDLGVIEADGEGNVREYIEKPTLNYDVSTGIYIMEPSVLGYIPPDGRFDLPDLVRALMQDRRKVMGYRFTGRWLDIGRHDDYAGAVEAFQEHRDKFLP